MNRYNFIDNLVMSLTAPHLQNRLQKDTLRKTLRISISAILQIEETKIERKDKLEKRKRCYFCKNKSDKKSCYCCVNCGKPICEDHRIRICYDCNT